MISVCIGQIEGAALEGFQRCDLHHASEEDNLLRPLAKMKVLYRVTASEQQPDQSSNEAGNRELKIKTENS